MSLPPIQLSADYTAPAIMGEAVAPSDAVGFTNGICRAIYVGGAGNIAVVFANDTAVTHVGVLAGSILPVNAKRINLTGTTATSMVAWF